MIITFINDWVRRWLKRRLMKKQCKMLGHIWKRHSNPPDFWQECQRCGKSEEIY